MNHWAPLWSFIVDSSLWEEDPMVIKLFLTMLALKDMDHVVRGSAFKLSRAAKMSEEECLRYLQVLASPDKHRIEPQPFEGRRIRMVEDGWLVINGAKYRALVSEEMRKAKNRRAAERYRQKNKTPKRPAFAPLPSNMCLKCGLTPCVCDGEAVP